MFYYILLDLTCYYFVFFIAVQEGEWLRALLKSLVISPAILSITRKSFNYLQLYLHNYIFLLLIVCFTPIYFEAFKLGAFALGLVYPLFELTLSV